MSVETFFHALCHLKPSRGKPNSKSNQNMKRPQVSLRFVVWWRVFSSILLLLLLPTRVFSGPTFVQNNLPQRQETRTRLASSSSSSSSSNNNSSSSSSNSSSSSSYTYICFICFYGFVPTKLDATAPDPQTTQPTTCAELQSRGLAGLYTLEQCNMIEYNSFFICGCQEQAAIFNSTTTTATTTPTLSPSAHGTTTTTAAAATLPPTSVLLMVRVVPCRHPPHSPGKYYHCS